MDLVPDVKVPKVLQFIGVPTSAGAYGVGQEGAPDAFRSAGLIARLGEAAVDGGDVAGVRFSPDPTTPSSQNIDAVVRVVESVRGHVAEALSGGDIPVVLGGDCTITVGVIAACVESDPDCVLAYFDGDVDLSTPANTRSGILDAMGMAHILDLEGTDRRLAGAGDRVPLMSGDRIALIGHEQRDLSAREEDILDGAGAHRFPAEDLRAGLHETVDFILDALGDSPRIVHFDIDAVDSIDCPLAEYPHFNTGVTLDDAEYILGHLCDTQALRALVVTEINPLHDPDGIHILRVRDLLVRVLGRTQEKRR